jgi:hypothetical protein
MEKFEVRFDAKARRLHWTMRGFWTMADVAAFATALRATVEPLGPPPHRYDGLCDSRDFPVQARDVSDALGMIEQVGRAMHEGRIAIVVGSVTNKLQAQRTLTGDRIRVFLDIDEARTWLAASAAE